MSIFSLKYYCLWLFISLFATTLYADNLPQDLTLRFEQGHVILSDESKIILFKIAVKEIQGVIIKQKNVRSLLIDFQNDPLPLPISYHGSHQGQTTIVLKHAPLNFIKHRLTGDNTGQLFWQKKAPYAHLRYQGASTILLEDSYPQQLIVEIDGKADIVFETTEIARQKRIKSRTGGADTIFKSLKDQPVFVSVRSFDSHKQVFE